MKANTSRKQEKSEAPDDVLSAPGEATLRQNVIFMIRLLAIAAVVLAALWGLDHLSLMK
jgi:hypothetical protein